jgi:hypothetical protein
MRTGGFKGKGAGKPGSKGVVKRVPPRRPIRRSALISPFGVGSSNDFRNDEALMCAGLDMWFRTKPDQELIIEEERLQGRLGCTHFIKPPDFGEGVGVSKQQIPHVRFPLWHYCPRCFQMKSTTLFGQQPQCDNCSTRGPRRRMIPVRIVAICEGGHIEDFPYQHWIGCGCEPEKRKLSFKAGRSAASLAGIKIDCSECGRTRSLAGAFEEDAITTPCCGAQPWLGREIGEHQCGHKLRAVQRGGANVYFPLVVSSIFIPPTRTAETEAIQRVLDNPNTWQGIASGLVDGKVNPALCHFLATQLGVDAEALSAAAQARISGSSAAVIATSEEEFRRQEYEVLSNGAGSPRDDLFVEPQPGSSFGWLAKYVEKVGLVRKLRETRVHVGFSRLNPQTDRGDPDVQPLSIKQDLPWLPAIAVRGEGIFVQLRKEAIDEWLSGSGATRRVGDLISDFNDKRRARKLLPRAVDARFVMVHTLAHAIIKELTFSCGYGSSSLRERLYCNLEDPARPMNGFLIYTASGDAEGTLGGLVSQATGGHFERLVDDALRRASWCSNDPVCMESPDTGFASSNLAACHGCVLLPETSCEEGNRLLDRALLVGTIEEPALGLFKDAPFRTQF